MATEQATESLHASDAAWEALQGAYDLQVHVFPDVVPRRIDDDLTEGVKLLDRDGKLLAQHVHEPRHAGAAAGHHDFLDTLASRRNAPKL